MYCKKIRKHLIHTQNKGFHIVYLLFYNSHLRIPDENNILMSGSEELKSLKGDYFAKISKINCNWLKLISATLLFADLV